MYVPIVFCFGLLTAAFITSCTPREKETMPAESGWAGAPPVAQPPTGATAPARPTVVPGGSDWPRFGGPNPNYSRTSERKTGETAK